MENLNCHLCGNPLIFKDIGSVAVDSEPMLICQICDLNSPTDRTSVRLFCNQSQNKIIGYYLSLYSSNSNYILYGHEGNPITKLCYQKNYFNDIIKLNTYIPITFNKDLKTQISSIVHKLEHLQAFA